MHEGSNEFKLKHYKKNQLKVNGRLPLSIPLLEDIIAKAQALRPLLTIPEDPLAGAVHGQGDDVAPMAV